MKLALPKEPRKKRLAIAGIAIAIGGAYYLISRVIPHDELQQLLEDISNTLGAWTYLLVGFFAFAETGAVVGLVVPGETVMLLGGAVAGQGAIDIYILIAIAWFAAWAGDSTSFFIGRRLGRDFLLRHGPKVNCSSNGSTGRPRRSTSHPRRPSIVTVVVSAVGLNTRSSNRPAVRRSDDTGAPSTDSA